MVNTDGKPTIANSRRYSKVDGLAHTRELLAAALRQSEDLQQAVDEQSAKLARRERENRRLLASYNHTLENALERERALERENRRLQDRILADPNDAPRVPCADYGENGQL